MGEEEVAPIVRDRPSAQSAFYAVLGVLVVASAVLVDLNYGTSEERIALSEVVIIWATLLLLYFLFNRPFITRVNTERRVQSWIKRWLYTTNHKEVGILYIVTSLFLRLSVEHWLNSCAPSSWFPTTMFFRHTIITKR